MRCINSLILLFSLLCPPTAFTQVIVNEVLSNEPGAYTSLEWIEFYNASDSPVSLHGYSFVVGETVQPLPSDVVLASGEYFIACRRLYSTETSPGFESVWGDSSGVWGDTPDESYRAPFVTSFSLKNDSGAVFLTCDGQTVSQLEWTESAADGCSWERLAPDSVRIVQSQDPAGCTPGLVNSLTPLPHDLALTSAHARLCDGLTCVEYEISNIGLLESAEASLSIIEYRVTADTLAIIPLAEVPAGITVDGEYAVALNGTYATIELTLPDDDRIRNNSTTLTAPGTDFPPLILSEILPNPAGDLVSEWIEIKNRSDRSINLCGWHLGDDIHTNIIAADSLLLPPGEYIVLVQSEQDFYSYYYNFAEYCHEPTSWASLNNDGDCVRLTDDFGIEADRHCYSVPFDENYTIARSEESGAFTAWGRSTDIGGTPGHPNEILVRQTASSLAVSVDPEYISPDGDGFEDFTTISITAPSADAYTVKLFDRYGRVVRTIFDEEPMIPTSFEFDGLADSGRKLPIGLYLLYVEACGKESTKQPIVIAR